MAEKTGTYVVARVSARRFQELETTWRSLEQGDQMSAFQRFEWASLINERVLAERASRLFTRSRYYVVSRDGQPVMIAPFSVHRLSLSPGHRRGVHLAGRGGPGDFLNLVYRTFDPRALETALDAVVQDFGIRQVYLERVLTDTGTFRWISSLPGATVQSHDAIHLILPEDNNTYTSMLSKSTRQNIRTAWNRARTDGVELKVELLRSISKADARLLSNLKKRRENIRSLKVATRLRRLLPVLRRAYFAVLFASHDEPEKAMLNASEPLVMRVSVDDELAAFAFGLTDKFAGQRTLRLLQVGIDDRFGRYSPGMLGLHHFITTEIEAGRPHWDVVDFTRGEERYKTQLGGIRHSYANVTFRWPL